MEEERNEERERVGRRFAGERFGGGTVEDEVEVKQVREAKDAH
jgi:hypothetical protein